ncbi:serine hydrolase [Phycicoccus jejuensis]|uniref:serine hydrolase n=1 Tax=Phycicoccus jejuensis TaxID=367299 RepID=UPI000A7AEF26|nr:serine hydrolase [Phycicoccus jejuensis]
MPEPARTANLREALRADLADAGLRASLLARNLGTGREVAIDADVLTPAASLAKLPLALAVLTRVDDGRLDGGARIEVPPGQPHEATPGLGRLRHPAVVAVEDLVGLALTVSDNAAADALLRLVPPAEVTADLDALGVAPMVVRHPFAELSDTPLDRLPAHEGHLAHTLAIRGSTPAHGHPVRQLDVARTNVVTARSTADLLERVWTGRGLRPAVAERLREHLHGNALRHRLAPDLASDDARWASKTGSLLNLRHEAGVVEHADGTLVVVVALSTSSVPASVQPAADASLGAAARAVHDHVR